MGPSAVHLDAAEHDLVGVGGVEGAAPAVEAGLGLGAEPFEVGGEASCSASGDRLGPRCQRGGVEEERGEYLPEMSLEGGGRLEYLDADRVAVDTKDDAALPGQGLYCSGGFERVDDVGRLAGQAVDVIEI